MRFRNYHPHLGLWLNRDLILERGGINLICYSGNNPLNWFDLIGLTPAHVLWVIGVSAAAVVGGIAAAWDTDDWDLSVKHQQIDPCTIVIFAAHGLRQDRFDEGGNLLSIMDIWESEVPFNIVCPQGSAATAVGCCVGNYVKIQPLRGRTGDPGVSGYMMSQVYIVGSVILNQIVEAFTAGKREAVRLCEERWGEGDACKCDNIKVMVKCSVAIKEIEMKAANGMSAESICRLNENISCS